jgi:hypothetical protein
MDGESDRAVFVLRAALEHFEYGRKLIHDLINSYGDTASVGAIAAEQAIEMDLRHAVTDTAVFARNLPKGAST